MTSSTQGHIAMLVFSLLVAGSFSLGALAANEIAPGALNALRFGLAAVLIGVVIWTQGGVTQGAFQAPWRYLLLGGIFGTYFVLMFEGLKTAPPVSAAAVFTLIPVMSAGFGWLLMRQRLSRHMLIALCVGGCGALWVIFRADITALLAFEIGVGEMIYFVGCVFHALYTPLSRRLNRGEPAMVFSFGVLVAGCLLLSLYGWNDISHTDWLHLPAIVWITLIYLVVFASAVSFVLIQFATMRLPSAKVMAYTYLTPSWVILWQIVLNGTMPTLWILGGIGLIILALLMLLKNETGEG